MNTPQHQQPSKIQISSIVTDGMYIRRVGMYDSHFVELVVRNSNQKTENTVPDVIAILLDIAVSHRVSEWTEIDNRLVFLDASLKREGEYVGIMFL